MENNAEIVKVVEVNVPEKVTVKAVKEGWTHKRKKIAVGDTVDVTKAQAEKLVNDGFAKIA